MLLPGCSIFLKSERVASELFLASAEASVSSAQKTCSFLCLPKNFFCWLAHILMFALYALFPVKPVEAYDLEKVNLSVKLPALKSHVYIIMCACGQFLQRTVVEEEFHHRYTLQHDRRAVCHEALSAMPAFQVLVGPARRVVSAVYRACRRLTRKRFDLSAPG